MTTDETFSSFTDGRGGSAFPTDFLRFSACSRVRSKPRPRTALNARSASESFRRRSSHSARARTAFFSFRSPPRKYGFVRRSQPGGAGRV